MVWSLQLLQLWLVRTTKQFPLANMDRCRAEVASSLKGRVINMHVPWHFVSKSCFTQKLNRVQISDQTWFDCNSDICLCTYTSRTYKPSVDSIALAKNRITGSSVRRNDATWLWRTTITLLQLRVADPLFKFLWIDWTQITADLQHQFCWSS
mgnify:CR=1 FL=1